ncbi:hypothetical protein [Bacillus cytotoxicus]
MGTKKTGTYVNDFATVHKRQFLSFNATAWELADEALYQSS